MRYFKHLVPVFILTFILSYHTESYADSKFYQQVTSARGAAQPFWMIERDNAVASLILFAGGNGVLEIDQDGIGKTGNFLVRSRQLFAKQGFNVAVIDKPNDKDELFDFRGTVEHAQDIKAVIRFLRTKYSKPVWLVGTSRGTISAANAAARLTAPLGPDGIVLTSSVVVSSKHQSLSDIAVDKITIPTLFVHNRDDGCRVSRFNDLDAVMAKFVKVRDKALQAHTGGKTKQNNPCKAKTPHGYLGLEETVVKQIADWVKIRV